MPPRKLLKRWPDATLAWENTSHISSLHSGKALLIVRRESLLHVANSGWKKEGNVNEILWSFSEQIDQKAKKLSSSHSKNWWCVSPQEVGTTLEVGSCGRIGTYLAFSLKISIIIRMPPNNSHGSFFFNTKRYNRLLTSWAVPDV